MSGSVARLDQGTENIVRDDRSKEHLLTCEKLGVKGAEAHIRCQRLPGHLPAGWEGAEQRGCPSLPHFAALHTTNSARLSEGRPSLYQVLSAQIYQAGNMTSYLYTHI